MTDNMKWVELHDLITEMKQKLETQESVTRTISRINYSTLLSILTNQSMFQYDKSIHLKLNVQHGVISITLKRSKKA